MVGAAAATGIVTAEVSAGPRAAAARAPEAQAAPVVSVADRVRTGVVRADPAVEAAKARDVILARASAAPAVPVRKGVAREVRDRKDAVPAVAPDVPRGKARARVVRGRAARRAAGSGIVAANAVRVIATGISGAAVTVIAARVRRLRKRRVRRR